jgi:hypothetical protein
MRGFRFRMEKKKQTVLTIVLSRALQEMKGFRFRMEKKKQTVLTIVMSRALQET